MAIKLVYTMPVGNCELRVFDIDGPAAYTDGGEVYTAKQLYTGRIMQVWASGLVTKSTMAPLGAVQAFLQPNTAEQGSANVTVVMCTTPAGGTAVTGAVDLSAGQFRLCVLGSPT